MSTRLQRKRVACYAGDEALSAIKAMSSRVVPLPRLSGIPAEFTGWWIAGGRRSLPSYFDGDICLLGKQSDNLLQVGTAKTRAPLLQPVIVKRARAETPWMYMSQWPDDGISRPRGRQPTSAGDETCESAAQWHNHMNDGVAGTHVRDAILSEREARGGEGPLCTMHVAFVIDTWAVVKDRDVAEFYSVTIDAGRTSVAKHLKNIAWSEGAEGAIVASQIASVMFQIWWTLSVLATQGIVDTDRHLGNAGVVQLEREHPLYGRDWAYATPDGTWCIIPAKTHNNYFVRLFDFDCTCTARAGTKKLRGNLALSFRQTVAYVTGKRPRAPCGDLLSASDILQRIPYVEYNLRALFGERYTATDMAVPLALAQTLIEHALFRHEGAGALVEEAPLAWTNIEPFLPFRSQRSTSNAVLIGHFPGSPVASETARPPTKKRRFE